MRKYTTIEYAEMAHKANQVGKALVVENGRLKFTDLPAVTIHEAKAEKMAEIESGQIAVNFKYEVYSMEERASWPFKLAEAEELMYDLEAEAPMLRAELAASGSEETIIELARKVLAKNAAYKRISGYLGGQKKRFIKELEILAAKEGVTAQDILDYKFEYSLPEIEVEEAPQVENPESEPLTLEPDVKEPSKSLFQRLFRTA